MNRLPAQVEQHRAFIERLEVYFGLPASSVRFEINRSIPDCAASVPQRLILLGDRWLESTPDLQKRKLLHEMAHLAVFPHHDEASREIGYFSSPRRDLWTRRVYQDVKAGRKRLASPFLQNPYVPNDNWRAVRATDLTVGMLIRSLPTPLRIVEVSRSRSGNIMLQVHLVETNDWNTLDPNSGTARWREAPSSSLQIIIERTANPPFGGAAYPRTAVGAPVNFAVSKPTELDALMELIDVNAVIAKRLLSKNRNPAYVPNAWTEAEETALMNRKRELQRQMNVLGNSPAGLNVRARKAWSAAYKPLFTAWQQVNAEIAKLEAWSGGPDDEEDFALAPSPGEAAPKREREAAKQGGFGWAPEDKFGLTARELTAKEESLVNKGRLSPALGQAAMWNPVNGLWRSGDRRTAATEYWWKKEPNGTTAVRRAREAWQAEMGGTVNDHADWTPPAPSSSRSHEEEVPRDPQGRAYYPGQQERMFNPRGSVACPGCGRAIMVRRYATRLRCPTCDALLAVERG